MMVDGFRRPNWTVISKPDCGEWYGVCYQFFDTEYAATAAYEAAGPAAVVKRPYHDRSDGPFLAIGQRDIPA